MKKSKGVLVNTTVGFFGLAILSVYNIPKGKRVL